MKRDRQAEEAPLLSVVIPAFNEEHRLSESLRLALEYFRRRAFDFEIILVDDGSTDLTSEIAEHYLKECGKEGLLRLLKNDRNRGKGYSVRRGMLAARAQFALMTDSDLSTPLEEFAKLEKEVMEGPFDIAFGSRDVPGSLIQIRQSLLRETSGKIFNRMVRMITFLPFRDTQCGFKLFDLGTCRPLFEKQTIHNFAFDVEILFIARKWGLSLREVPVVWRHAGGSKVRFMRDAPRMFLDLHKIRFNGIRGLYNRPSDRLGGDRQLKSRAASR
jgi:dolichyl-phosphate beta-glucosyltransferase